MIGNRATQQAERASQRYKTLLTAFEGIYQQNLSSEPGAPRTIRRAIQSAYQLADAYLTEETLHIDSAMSATQNDAYSATVSQLSVLPDEPTSTVTKNTDALASELDSALRMQLERDVGAISKGLRATSLRASVIASGRGISRSEALKIARIDASTKFIFQDRAGRNYSSSKYVRSVWRHSLVLAWNETALLTLADHGEITAEIQHPDEGHEWHGELISLNEQGTLPTWEDVRDDVFHPNTEAWVSAATTQNS